MDAPGTRNIAVRESFRNACLEIERLVELYSQAESARRETESSLCRAVEIIDALLQGDPQEWHAPLLAQIRAIKESLPGVSEPKKKMSAKSNEV